MKLTDAQKLDIYRDCLRELIRLEPKTTPPAKDGSAKPATRDFAAATWALRYARSAVYVLEKADNAKGEESQSW